MRQHPVPESLRGGPWGEGGHSTRQLLSLPWTRQLELLADNERCDLPGFEEGAQPSKNLVWILLGYDSTCQHFPLGQHFNPEDCASDSLNVH